MGKTITLDQLAKKIKRLEKELPPGRDFFKRQAMIVMNNRAKDMDRGIGFDGKSFTPLKERTIRRKRQTGSKTPNTPLVNRGFLKKAGVDATKSGGRVRPNKRRQSPDITTFHNKGMGSLPVRKHWGISDKSRKTIGDNWNKHIRARIHKVFG